MVLRVRFFDILQIISGQREHHENHMSFKSSGSLIKIKKKVTDFNIFKMSKLLSFQHVINKKSCSCDILLCVCVCG